MNSKFTKIVRILLGIILDIFGLNKLLPEAFIRFLNCLKKQEIL